MVVALHSTVVPAEVLLAARPDRRADIGPAGLALYLTGVGQGAHPRRSEVSPRSYGWLPAGSLLPGPVAGALSSVWVVWRDAAGERGTAPTAALLLPSTAFAVTAVPVSARILTDRGIADPTEGRLPLLVAVSIDALTWLLLTSAPAAAAVAVAAALATERAGLTAVFCAVLVGLAVPQDGEQEGGGCAGARAARLPTGTALRFGVLMNTRGLTAIAVSQDGLSAGILSAGLCLVMPLMALVTTAVTGPLLSFADHRCPAPAVLPRPASEELSHDKA
ncbi:hypothetical protein [Streptomyces sp. NPDC004658]|uniref:hypothetical protein n=1 Tax=Streptomyces sp. NPDC004658 TaxID=3154672 RepID=UPI0033A6CDA9